MRAYTLTIALLLACACLVGSAHGRPVELRARLAPGLLGHTTAVSFTVRVDPPAAGVMPPALTEATLRYPAALDFALSGLGIEDCPLERLAARGPLGCPPDSLIGTGTALAEVELGARILHESMKVTIVRAPEQGDRTTVLFYADGTEPVDAQLAFVGRMLPASPPYGGRLQIKVPPVAVLPGTPDLAIVELHATIGPPGLTYYEHVGRRLVAYHPRGVPLVGRCPRGGFPFAATFTFLDGSHVTARSAAPCRRG